MNKLLFLCLLFSIHIKAQNPFVKEETAQQQFTIKHNSNNTTTNPIIKALAGGNGKPLQNTQLKLTLNQTIITSTREPLQHSGIVSSALEISGDVYYKGFDVTPFLFPATIQYTFKTWNNTNLLASKSFNTVKVSDRIPEKKESTYDDISGNVTHHTVENFLTNYSTQNIQTFTNRVDYINQYFADGSRLTQSINLVQSMKPNDIDRFNIQQQNLSDAVQSVKTIENKNYNNELNLPEYDPVKMLNNISLFHSQAAIMQQELDHVCGTLYLAYYDRGIDLLRLGNINGAENYFHLSLGMSPGFAPSLLQLAVIDFRRNNMQPAVSKCDDIIYLLNADPETRRLTFQLLNDIYESRLDIAATAINERKYSNALEHYLFAKSICERFTNIRCSDELFNGIRIAKNGIYNEYLETANDFLANKKFDKAEKAAGDAIRYQRDNRNEITDDSEARKILKEISRQLYLSKIEAGKIALNNQQYETALNAFNDATEMEINNGFAANTELPSLKTTAARPVIISKLNTGDSLVNINKLPEARNMVRTVADMQAKYGLGNEKSISKRLEELRKKIFSLQCENAQRDFDDAYIHGKDALSRLEYVNADDFFISAKKANTENRDCEINTRNIEEEHAAIIPAAIYLKMMAQFKSQQQEGNYTNAETIYEEAGNYFTANNVSRFNITHESFYNYLLNKANTGFLFYAGNRYTANNELDKALTLYRLLILRQYENKQLNESLYQLGIKFGRNDKLDHPGEKYHKDFVQEYVNGDKKMKSFEKGYKKGWKN